MSKIKEWCQMLVDSGVIPQLPANIDCATYEQYVKYLEAENAALRERLEKAVELTEPHWELCPYSGMYIVYYKAIVPKSEAYDDRAAAEARLAELKGEKQ